MTWIVLDKTLWRWGLDGKLAEVDVPHPVDSVRWAGGVLIARCGGGLYRVDPEPTQSLTGAVRAWDTDETSIVYMTPEGDVSIGNREGTVHFSIPLRATFDSPLFLRNSKVIYGMTGVVAGARSGAVVIWTDAPATTEAELHARLAAMTNATTHASSSHSTWPE